jgi:anti-sigma factor RsiW
MSRSTVDSVRTEALSTFLDDRARAGYSVETRTATQAVIVRRRRMFSLLGMLRPGAANVRLVVSVDHDGLVSTVAAEPRRW